MPSSDAIRDLLPSLWRPEPDARGLLPDVIAASGQGLDLARIDAGNTMQAHWSRFADYAPISPFVAAFRRAAGLPVLLPSDDAVQTHPYLDDLARLAGLLALVPYTDPSTARETVEDFRRRLLGTVALYRDGVGTRSALDRAARLALSGTDERAVMVEEFAPGATQTQDIVPRGVPEELVGPLMRWEITSQSLVPVSPDIFITGVTPVPDLIDATSEPIIEQFDPKTGTGTGVLYDGTVAPDQVLAIRASHSSWLAGPTGLQVATSLPGDAPANPTAPGPWAAAPGAPATAITALAQAADGAVWAAVDDSGTGQLWRHDTSGWTLAIDTLPDLHCLLARGDDLLVGHANGLSRLPVFAATLALDPDPGAQSDAAVLDLSEAADGTLWAATAQGAARMDGAGVLQPIGPGARAETETPLAAVLAEADGLVHFGGDLGIFRHDTRADIWHVFRGESLDESEPDWTPWAPASDALPADTDVFLPAVTALLRGPDTSLWIGTANGLAVWGAFRIRNTYATRLRAFPALGTGPVHRLALDERGRLWIGADRGLLVHDGTDWFENDSALTRITPRLPADPVGSGWRFDRTGGGAWQYSDPTTRTGFQAQSPGVITTDQGAVMDILWSDGAVAQLGSLTDGVFEEDSSATPAALRQRIKPTADRIVEGGLPAIPRLGPGRSHWRYLREEQASPPTPTDFPAWTREGRLLTPPNDPETPYEGRYITEEEDALLRQVFAFNPAASVSFQWAPKAPLSITVRLDKPVPDETLPAVVSDRVFAALDRVRPAGSRVTLAFGETLVKGNPDG